MEIRLSGHSAYRTEYHMVWVCKYRRRILNPGLRGYLRKLFPKIMRSLQGQFIEMVPRDISAPQTLFKWNGASVKEFSEKWLISAPSHHHTAAYGKLSNIIGKVSRMLSVEHVMV